MEPRMTLHSTFVSSEPNYSGQPGARQGCRASLPRRPPNLRALLIALIAGVGAAAAHADPVTIPGVPGPEKLAEARAKLHHVIVIMQENRSFDHYFGTFPGADGFPTDGNGNITVCVPLDPRQPALGCVAPFHDHAFVNAGGGHTYHDAIADIDNGAMDGFIFQQTGGQPGCHKPKPGFCPGIEHRDVMGYHTAEEIRNYWDYAKTFMLQDHLFEPVVSWSFVSHLYEVSEWSAECKTLDPFSCRTDVQLKVAQYRRPRAKNFTLPWTSIIWLLEHGKVTWKYYLGEGAAPNCADEDEGDCTTVTQKIGVPGAWNPFPFFSTFKDAEARRPGFAAHHVVPLTELTADLQNGALPSIAWLAPYAGISEHPPHDLRAGVAHVTSVVNAIMQSQYWNDTVIFISWDDWGGFYDHVLPPISDRANGQVLGYGLRVPGLIISPWVKAGTIDHQVMSFDAYNRLVEDLFLDSERMDPNTDGRPDPRPSVRDALTTVTDRMTGAAIPVGDLLNDFDFKQKPLPPLILPLPSQP
jgi:phospholipase C